MESSLKRREPMHHHHQQQQQPDSDAENDIMTTLGDRLVSPCKRLRLHDTTPDKNASALPSDRAYTPGVALLDQTNQGVTFLDTPSRGFGSLMEPTVHDPSLADVTRGGEEEGSGSHGVTFLDQTNTKAVQLRGNDKRRAATPGSSSSSGSDDTTSTLKSTVVPTLDTVSSTGVGFQGASRFLTGLPLARDGSRTSIRYTFNPVTSGGDVPGRTKLEENAPASGETEQQPISIDAGRERALSGRSNETDQEKSSCQGEGEELSDQAGARCNGRPETPSNDEGLDFPEANAGCASPDGEQHSRSRTAATPQHRIPNNTPERSVVTDSDEEDDSDVDYGFHGIVINRMASGDLEWRPSPSPVSDDCGRWADGGDVVRPRSEGAETGRGDEHQRETRAGVRDSEPSVAAAPREADAGHSHGHAQQGARQTKHPASLPSEPDPASGEGFLSNHPASQSEGSLKPTKDFNQPRPQGEGFHQQQRDHRDQPGSEGFERAQSDVIFQAQSDRPHPLSKGFEHAQSEVIFQAQSDLPHPRSKGFERAQTEGSSQPPRGLGQPDNEGFYYPMGRARSSTLDRPLPVISHPESQAFHRQQNVAQRLRFSSASNLLCPEELDHHWLSLQSYGSLAHVASNNNDLGLQRQRAVSSGSCLDGQGTARFHGLPPDPGPPGEHPLHRRHFSASSAGQGSAFRPQNLDQRFRRAIEPEGRKTEDCEGAGRGPGSGDSRGRLVHYGSIDALPDRPGHHRLEQAPGGLVNYGNVDGPLGGVPPLPRPAQTRLAEAPGDSNQAKLWFYGSVDDPQRIVRSHPSVLQADAAGQASRASHRFGGNSLGRQGSLAHGGSEQAFFRSANRRTLPRLGGPGGWGRPGDQGDFRESIGHLDGHDSAPYLPSRAEKLQGQQGHPPPAADFWASRAGAYVPHDAGVNHADDVGVPQQEHHQQGILTHPGVDHHGLHVHFQHAASAGSSGPQAGGGGGGLGSFDHYDVPADPRQQQHHHHNQLTHSSSQGSVDSHGRSAGSQRSGDSQGRRSGRSQRSSGSQRSTGSQDGQATSGSQGSGDGGGRRSAGGGERHRPEEEAFPVFTEAELKRKVLETAGQLLVAVYLNCGLVTVHVIEGRSLTCTWKPVCDAYIKLSLIPEEGGRKLRLKSKPVLNTSNPVFDEKFSLELQKSDENKRLLVSIWHKDLNSGCSEFLGCMSFGVKGILRNKEVNGWYYLLTEDVGKKKHLEVTSRPKAALRVRGHNIPPINRDVLGLDTVTMKLERGKNGFGFTVVDEFPVKVGRVDLASPAEGAGLKPGDFVIKVNNQNVSRSTVNSVAKLVKKSGDTLVLIVHRPQPAPEPPKPSKPAEPLQPADPPMWKRPEPIYESIPEEMTHDGTVIVDSSNKENEISMRTHLEMSSVYMPFTQGKLSASTPLPAKGMKLEGSATDTAETDEQKKCEAIHRLMSLELDFIDFMQLGIKRYCRPLKHCIFNVGQHSAVFQNVEKLVNISEYHVQQLQENAPPMYPDSDDDSQSSEDKHFASAVAMIYYSKAHMFCQAHESYAEGLSAANRVLSDMRQNEEFLRFIKDPPLDPGQPSISAFIFRPLQHIKELSAVFQEIFAITPKASTDYTTLKQVTQVLQESVVNISNMSNARVQSLMSLTSHTKSSSSGKGSCAASSVASSRADSGSESGRTKKKESLQPSGSLQTVRLLDREVLQVQDRLVFSDNVPVFQLCQEDRHIIYQGELFYLQNNNWSKIQVVLFSDILLLCRPDKDGSLRVLRDPVLLHQVCQLESSSKHSTELILRICPTSPCTGIPTTQRLTFRTPTPQDLSTWKNLLEQRIKTVQGHSAFGHPALCGDHQPASGFVH